MSSSTSFPAAEAIEYLTQNHTANCCLAATATLAVYEHIITFDSEVLAIWRYRMTGPTILLLFNRYVLLLTDAFGTATWTSDQISICKAQVVLSNVTFVLSIVIGAGFSALRVYAIAGRNWYWSLLALSTGLVPAATNIYQFISESHPYVAYLFGIPQCLQNSLLSESVFDRLIIATGTCAIVSDLVVVIATWMYARPWARYASNTQIKTPLMLAIVRDGTGYFIVLLILSTAQMVTEQLSYSEADNSYLVYITVFPPVISPILISRFIFNLRLHIDHGNSTGSNDPSFMAGSMESRGRIESGSRLVGHMGAPLDHSIPNSLLLDDSDEPDEDIGCNVELVNTLTCCASCQCDFVSIQPVEQTHNVERDGEARSDAENQIGAVTTP